MAGNKRVGSSAIFYVSLLAFILPKLCLAQCEQTILTDFINIGTNDVTVKVIDNNPSPMGWEYEIGVAGFSPDFQADGFSDTQEFIIDNLSSGTLHELYLRTICTVGDTSQWNGPFSFYTIISNNETCFLTLPIEDNSCGNNNRFPIEVSGFGNSAIGEIIFIQSISLTIEHTFPEDLEINMISPDGKEITLSSDNGLGTQHYGNPLDSMCAEVVSFSDLACQRITEFNGQFSGEFQPEDAINGFDGCIADGIWILEICDKNQGDVGILRHVEIEFDAITCPVPTQLFFCEVHADSIVLQWPAPVNCQGMLINYGPEGFMQGTENTIFVNCLEESFTIDDLDPLSSYDIYLSTVCNGTESPYSCQFNIETSCHNITYLENFDDYDLCTTTCLDTCHLTGTWTNLQIDQRDWIVYDDSTPTDFTGPRSDFKGNGRYLYIENQTQFCDAGTEAVLESPCMQFSSNFDGCDMSFAYHMFGNEVSYLQMIISTDNKQQWDTLFNLSGEQGENWIRETIDLSDYHGKSGFIRLIAAGAVGSFGDIAIDDLNFYGSVYDPLANIFYEDVDLDGFGDINSDQFIFCIDTIPLGFAKNNLDCDDTNTLINPDAIEINCNSVDENCNGLFNESGGIGMIEVVDAVIVDETCQQGSNGRIELILEGGVSPFEYSWSNQSNATILTNISNGMYSCTIEDATGCQTVKDSLVVGISDSLTYTITEYRNVTCLDTDNGLISIMADGGSGIYDYQWSNGTMDVPFITDLSEDDYQFTLTDSDGCMLVSEIFSIVEDEIFMAFVDSLKHVDCQGDMSGYIGLNTTGISPIDQIIWSTNINDVTSQSNLSGGYYGVTVSTTDGCTSTIDSILVEEPGELGFKIEAIEDIICFDGNSGSIDISVLGGSPPFEFVWNNGDLTEDIENLHSGFYSVHITDANDCGFQSPPIFVSTQEPIVINVDSIHHVDCSGSSDGYMEISSSGGGGEFQYFWNTNLADSNVIMNAPAGLYTVTVVDGFGCKSEVTTFSIDLINSPIHLDHEILDSNICFGDATADIAVEAISGNLPIEFNWSNGIKHISFNGQDTIFNLDNGLYKLTVTDALGCTGIDSFTVEEIEKLNFFNIVDQISCIGANDGEIRLDIDGGTPPYTYLWNNMETTPTITDLSPGSYMCTITDFNDCTISTQSILIEEPSPISFDLSTIFHKPDSIEIFLEINGGSAPHFCFWDSPKIILDDGCNATSQEDGIVELRIIDVEQCQIDTFIELDISTSIDKPLASVHKKLLINNISESVLLLRSPNDLSQFQVLDLNGRLITRWEITPGMDSFDISHLAAGIHFIRYYENNQWYSEKFVKL